jgi:hypothetical protein
LGHAYRENIMLFFAVNADATMDDAVLWKHFFESLREVLEFLDKNRREKRAN